MAHMNWDNSFSVGVEEIDTQHKNLIEMFNLLEKAGMKYVCKTDL